MIDDLILLVCTHLVMFWAGYKWGLHQAVLRIVRNFIDDPEHIRKTFSQLERVRAGLDLEAGTEDHVVIRAEWIGDQVYIYREDTGEFLAQGTDVEAAIKSIPAGDHDRAYHIPEDMAKKPEQVQP
jgi:hypothetical protein